MNYPFDIVHHLVIPKADHLITLLFQIICSFFVILILLDMLTPIQFNNQFCFGCAKIRDILSNSVLPSKIYPVQFVSA